MDFNLLKEGISIAQGAITLIRSAKDMLPSSPKKDEIENTVSQAEEKFALLEVQSARSMGYAICRCTWPPQIMLSIGAVEYGDKFRCPACGRVVSDDDMP